jgi:GNAT superfamily N-acetyltransferase
VIRRLKQGDSKKLEKILKKVSNFNQQEVEVAMELVDIAENNPAQEDYNIYVYEKDGRIFGYHCTGKRPLTDAVFDMYWIVADPEATEKGIGKKLLKHAEEFVKQNNGRWLLAETSSKDSYTRTRNFYLRNNYSIVAEINDFYSIGDNLIVFGKFFSQP